MTSNFDTSLSDDTTGIQSVSDVMNDNEWEFVDFCTALEDARIADELQYAYWYEKYVLGIS